MGVWERLPAQRFQECLISAAADIDHLHAHAIPHGTASLTSISHSSFPSVEEDMAGSQSAERRVYLRTEMQLGQGEQLEGALALLVCLQHLKLQQSR